MGWEAGNVKQSGEKKEKGQWFCFGTGWLIGKGGEGKAVER